MSTPGDTSLDDMPKFYADFWRKAAATTGLPDDQLRLLGCLVAAIVFGEVHKRLPNATIKHIFSIIIGVIYSFTLIGFGVKWLLLEVIIVYMMVAMLPRRWIGFSVFLFTMIYLSAGHLYRMYTDYLGWKMDHTLLGMMFTVKACTFAYNYSDGLAIKAEEKLHENPKVSDTRRQRALAKLPSLLEYFSYVFFFGGVLVGPCFEMKEYLDFTDLSLFRQNNLDRIPSTILPALKKVFYALICGAFMVLGWKFPVIGYMETDAYLTKTTFWYRYGYAWIAITCRRFQYYFAWYLAEAGCVAAGLGYLPPTKTTGVTWDRVNNANAWAVETASDLPTITNNWNIGVNNWLKHYIFFRINPPHWVNKIFGKNGLAQICTKMISAIWHGFYLGYYAFFASAALATFCDNDFKEFFWPQPLTATSTEAEKRSYTRRYVTWRVLGWLIQFGCFMNYYGEAFQILDASWGIAYWRSTYWIGHIIPVAFSILIRLYWAVTGSRAKAPKPLPEGKPATAAGNNTQTVDPKPKRSRKDE